GIGVVSLLAEAGNLWVGATTGLWQWKPSEPAHYAVALRNLNALLKSDDGPLLIGTPEGVRQLVGGQIQSFPSKNVGRPASAYRMLRDKDGGLWVGTLGRGLMHMPHERSDLFTQLNGLSGDVIRALYEDREGNVWVATNSGLDRFRDLAVTTMST